MSLPSPDEELPNPLGLANAAADETPQLFFPPLFFPRSKKGDFASAAVQWCEVLPG